MAGFAAISFIGRPDAAFIDGLNGMGQFVDEPDKADELMHTDDLTRSAAASAVDSARLIINPVIFPSRDTESAAPAVES